MIANTKPPDGVDNDPYRFEFGANWQRFLADLDEDQIEQANGSLRHTLDVTDLSGRTFLDIGSGSGLFSLAARQLGARVSSFDLDPQSVKCALALRERFFPGDADWSVRQGSILDPAFVSSLGMHDIVYSWGVLHHTGSMWRAIDTAGSLVRQHGTLFIALYNDQGRASQYWAWVKKQYNRFPVLRFPLQLIYAPYFVGLGWFVKRFRHRGGRAPRGMKLWTDMVDWLGGYPFEVASPESVAKFFTNKGFVLDRQYLIGSGIGCNEYIFSRPCGEHLELQGPL